LLRGALFALLESDRWFLLWPPFHGLSLSLRDRGGEPSGTPIARFSPPALQGGVSDLVLAGLAISDSLLTLNVWMRYLLRDLWVRLVGATTVYAWMPRQTSARGELASAVGEGLADSRRGRF